MPIDFISPDTVSIQFDLGLLIEVIIIIIKRKVLP